MHTRLFLIVLIFISTMMSYQLSFSQNTDEYNDDEFEYVDIDWKYLFFDLGWGGSGPGGALGFRYWNLGASIAVTGFANDIPLTAQVHPGENININELPTKSYPSIVVIFDVSYYYDFEKFTVYANVGGYSAIDSVLAYKEISGTTAYYRKPINKHAGYTFGAGIQAPLIFLKEDNAKLDQIVAGIGLHSELGIYLRIAYRWE